MSIASMYIKVREWFLETFSQASISSFSEEQEAFKFEQDYKDACAMLVRGNFDDYGQPFGPYPKTEGQEAALRDFMEMGQSFIEIGKQRQKRETQTKVDSWTWATKEEKK